MTLLGAGIYVGLGYAVRERFPWVESVFGHERVLALEMSYLRALGGLMSEDNDGDFFPDSAELYARTKPNDPLDHPPTILINSDWAISGVERGLVGTVRQYDPLFVCHPGERRRIRARVVLANGQRSTFRPGMRLRLTGGISPPALPESVPVATDGWVEFDLAITEDIVIPARSSGIRPTKGMMLVHPVTKEEFGHFYVDLVWRQPPFPCAVDENPSGDDVSEERSFNEDKTLHFARLTWAPPPVGTADVVYLEATPGGAGGDESNQEWFPVAFLRPDSSSYLLTYRHTAYSRSSRPGALKFRVVPARHDSGDPVR